MIKSVKKNHMYLLSAGFLVLLAALLAMGTLSMPRARADAPTPANCPNISYSKDSPNTIAEDIPFCRVDLLIAQLQQQSNQGQRCVVWTLIGRVAASQMLPGGLDSTFDTTLIKPIYRCFGDWINGIQVIGNFQQQRDYCKAQDPGNTGIAYQWEYSKDEKGTIQASLSASGCVQDNGSTGARSAVDSATAVSVLQLQLTPSGDGSTIIADANQDTNNIALNPADSVQDTTPDGSLAQNSTTDGQG